MKKSLFRKPLFLIVGLFITGIIFGRYFFPPFFVVFSALLFLLILSIILYLKHHFFTSFFLSSSFFLVGVLYFALFYYPLPSDPACILKKQNADRVSLIGKVASTPYIYRGKKKRVAFILKAEKMKIEKENFSPTFKSEWRQVKGKVWVTSFYPYVNFNREDIVLVKGRLFLPRASEKRNEFNWRNYLSYQGVWSEVNTGKVYVIEKGKPFFLLRYAFLFAEWMKKIIERGLSYPYSAVLKGMMLGEKEELPPYILNLFRATGVAHVLVVSGLHVGLLLFMIFFAGCMIGFSKKTALCIALPFVFFYALMSGLRPPIVRASLMATIAIFCCLMDREVPLVFILFLAAFFSLIANPLSLFTVSFQLSFLATGGIVLIVPYLEEKFSSLPNFLKKPFCISLGAQLSLFPLFSFYFKQLPLMGVLANLVVVPCASFVVSLGFFSILLSFFVFDVAQIFFNTTYLLLKLLLLTVNFFSFSFAPRIASFLSLKTEKPSLWLVLSYYLLLFSLPFFSFKNFKRKDKDGLKKDSLRF